MNRKGNAVSNRDALLAEIESKNEAPSRSVAESLFPPVLHLLFQTQRENHVDDRERKMPISHFLGCVRHPEVGKAGFRYARATRTFYAGDAILEQARREAYEEARDRQYKPRRILNPA